MTTTQFNFKSVGIAHNDESGFFKFLVQQEFRYANSNVIQWCKIEGLSIICTALEPQIIEWCKDVIKNGITTKSGHKYILIEQ